MSGDFDALGMRVERTMGQQFRIVSFQVLGTAAIGGVVLSQFDHVRRRAMLPPARLLPSEPALSLAPASVAEDETLVTPEPSTVILTGTGLALVVVSSTVRRRRQRDKARVHLER